MRVFKLEPAPQFANYLTPKGGVVTFYKGYTTSDDKEVIEFILAIKGVEEIKDTKDLKIPVPPSREGGHVHSSHTAEEGEQDKISHMDLLKRAVASSAATPQAAASNSTPATPTK